jgi:hypothetical protein
VSFGGGVGYPAGQGASDRLDLLDVPDDSVDRRLVSALDTHDDVVRPDHCLGARDTVDVVQCRGDERRPAYLGLYEDECLHHYPCPFLSVRAADPEVMSRRFSHVFASHPDGSVAAKRYRSGSVCSA